LLSANTQAVSSQRPPNASFLRASHRISKGEAAEDGAGHQAGAAGVAVVEEAADDFAGGGEAGDRVASEVSSTSASLVILRSAEGRGDAGLHGIDL